MRPTPRKLTAKRPAPRKSQAIKRPDAERELMRLRKMVAQAITELESEPQLYKGVVALEILRKALR